MTGDRTKNLDQSQLLKDCECHTKTSASSAASSEETLGMFKACVLMVGSYLLGGHCKGGTGVGMTPGFLI